MDVEELSRSLLHFLLMVEMVPDHTITKIKVKSRNLSNTGLTFPNVAH